MKFTIRREVYRRYRNTVFDEEAWRMFQYVGYRPIDGYLTFVYEVKFSKPEDASAFMLKFGHYITVMDDMDDV